LQAIHHQNPLLQNPSCFLLFIIIINVAVKVFKHPFSSKVSFLSFLNYFFVNFVFWFFEV